MLVVAFCTAMSIAQNAMVTFQVSAPDSTPVYVFGSWSGWSNYPGTPMTSIGGGFYTATLPLPASAGYEYLFVNGSAASPVKEVLDPSFPCTNGNAQYTNRVFNLGATDTTVCNNWASCATCTAPSGTVLVTFQVQNPPTTPVYAFGSWSGWGNYPGSLMTSVGNGTYSVTLPLSASTSYEYLFVNGATPVNEALSPSFPCTNGNPQYTNRTLVTTNTNETLCKVWETCNSCQTVVTNPVQLPVTFDDMSVGYNLTDFGNNTSSIVVDPTNASNMVVKTIKPVTAQPWAGTTVGGSVGFATPIPFAANATSMKVRVWSPDAGVPIRLKVEDANDATRSVETEATTTMAGMWETLTFNFANQATGTAALNLGYTFKKASIFFNFGTTGAQAGEKTYYWDDMSFVAPPPAAVQLPVTFESTTLNYALTDFGDNASTIITDPTNPNNKVAQTIKPVSAQPWAGTTVGGNVGFGTPIPFAAGATSMSVRVWSPDAGIPVRLKVEESNDPTKSVETEATTTMAGMWETLTFNFAVQATGTAAINFGYAYKKASIFFNFGTTGAQAGAKTYYWDDMMLASPPPPAGVQLPVTFESTTLNYALTDFGDNASTIIVDPTNPNNKVAQTIKPVSAQPWAGTTVGGNVGFGTPIPFAAGATSMSVRVWSPDAGIPVRLKVEESNDPTKSVETEATTTMAGMWETLTFNFAVQATGTAAINFGYAYKKASIFFNFGTTGAQAGAKTYYWDDMMISTAPPPPAVELPTTFESATLNYGLTDFGDNVSTIITDPTNPNNKVVQTIKPVTAQPWAGTTVGGNAGFGTAIPFTATATKMNVRVWSPDAGIPVRLKVEDPTNATRSVETEAITTVAGAWETLEFNFANQAAGTAALNLSYTFKKASIFFNFGTTGAQAGAKTYYWDDMMFGAVVATENILKTQLRANLNKNSFTLFSNDLSEVDNVIISDVLGRTIYASAKKVSTNNVIPVSLNSNTVYFITVKNNNETATIKALIAE